MTFAIVVAVLAAALAVSLVILLQAFVANAEHTALMRQREVTELATEVGGIVTPRLVAERLDMSVVEADRLLRSMVDDVHLVMGVDAFAGELRFEFPRLTQDPEYGTPGAYSRVRGR